jgi:hypothetical protein
MAASTLCLKTKTRKNEDDIGKKLQLNGKHLKVF